MTIKAPFWLRLLVGIVLFAGLAGRSSADRIMVVDPASDGCGWSGDAPDSGHGAGMVAILSPSSREGSESGPCYRQDPPEYRDLSGLEWKVPGQSRAPPAFPAV